jgi:predicted ATPase/DNA-binding CsgD family transcriptional regulator
MMQASPAFGLHGVPAQPNALVGRGREIEAIRRRFNEGSTRLITLSGPAGTGKTRVALAATDALAPEAPDGISLVDLSAFGDWRLVVPAIVHAISARKTGNRSALEIVQEALQQRRVLLVLDNFEQVLGAAPQVAEFLAACASLRILVTSREPLHLSWEYVLPIAPLALPDAAATGDPKLAAEAPAVQLFLQRATAVEPDFNLTAENCAAVAEICARLDGLPLAIELAAARIGVLSPEAMVTRLDHRLELLKGGARDHPARHQALRAAIDWSYALLEQEEQSLFRRLGVLAGGCSLDAAAAAGDHSAEPERTLDLVAALCDKSLLYRDDRGNGEPRFRMLETIREYALEQLAAGGEVDQTARRVCRHYLELALQAKLLLQGPDQRATVDRLELEHDNLRVSMRWLAGHDEALAALEMAAALTPFWSARGNLDEARIWLTSLLALPETASPTQTRAGALVAAADVERLQGNEPAARDLLQESVEIEKAFEDGQSPPSVLERNGMERPAGTHTAAHRPEVLSARELDVLRLIAKGMTNKEIAGELVLSVPTVQTHLSNIYRKIDIHGRAAATAYFLTQGRNT